jgi:hypothetical protein
MTKEQILGLIRHTLTFVGGIFIASGYVDEQTSTEIIGSALTLVGSVWSVVVKAKETSDVKPV